MNRLLLILAFTAATAHAQNLQFGPPQQSKTTTTSSTKKQLIDDIALIINQEAISQRQLQQEIGTLQRQLPPNLRNLPDTQPRLLEQVIMQHLINQLAARVKLSVNEKEIDQAIAQVAMQNQLSPSKLIAQVKKDTGMDDNAYRQQIAQQIMESKVKAAAVGNDIRITPEQIDEQLAQVSRQREATIDLQDLLLNIPELPIEQRGQVIKQDIAAISQALKEHHNDLTQVAQHIPNTKLNTLNNINMAQIPPRFARAIVGLNQGDIASTPVIDADGIHFLKLLTIKTDHEQNYIVPEANLSHILIRNNPQDPNQAKRDITQIYAALQKGANFAELAKRYSQDPASAIRGGALGWMSADSVDPRFAQQLETVPLNIVSAPFESSYGWHIILVTERHNVDRTEERIRDQIRETLYQTALEDAWQQYLQQLRQQAYIATPGI